MPCGKKRKVWVGFNPPTHFPSGKPISVKLRKALKLEYLKVHRKSR